MDRLYQFYLENIGQIYFGTIPHDFAVGDDLASDSGHSTLVSQILVVTKIIYI